MSFISSTYQHWKACSSSKQLIPLLLIGACKVYIMLITVATVCPSVKCILIICEEGGHVYVARHPVGAIEKVDNVRSTNRKGLSRRLTWEPRAPCGSDPLLAADIFFVWHSSKGARMYLLRAWRRKRGWKGGDLWS